MPGPFTCPHAGCGRSYNRKEHLGRHERTHGQHRPFNCVNCGASFYRRDLLNRHTRLSVKCQSLQAERAQVSPQENTNTPNSEEQMLNGPESSFSNHHATVLESNASASGDMPRVPSQEQGLSSTSTSSSNSNSNSSTSTSASASNSNSNSSSILVEISNKQELRRAYLSNFHPHWPLLDEDVFKLPQIPTLADAILIAGLWMIPRHDARREARAHHHRLIQELSEMVLNERNRHQYSLWTHPSPENLPHFQACLIPLIICTYRGTEDLLNTFMLIKHLFDIFRRAGVYEQRRIDEACSRPRVRQQYQRLGLLHYKVYMHFNTLLSTTLPLFAQLQYFTPRVLQLQAPIPPLPSSLPLPPVPPIATPGSSSSSLPPDCLISDLKRPSGRQPFNKAAQTTMAALVAWDFCVGMIISCIVSQREEEDKHDDERALLARIEPYLFAHLEGWWNGEEEEE
ncbi:hypothetical protein F4778DRAFT_279951 [Xylariomycetidae sp. FL2044]|nr:hypothetical protein F4778DRAFT_279951 [Xylariomycetidae sp. FL2044]